MIYAVAKITITNPDSLAAYGKMAGPALAKHGGKVEGAAREFTVLDGSPEISDMVAILSFPDKDAAVAWSTDPDLDEVHELRRGAGGSDIVLLG
ncbi:Uncharacterized conserved protein, DUF1330 family [Jannaschia faecimaris]|uniref:Uncharacterized conserved protein, DUF1330 family n=1 Tax=Jannaschia faecimaris TaxID=1244108 RepID=A0A1H3TXA5_9RHOB|nr:DUF1330 domain-containing protein [Jannaschia faecimaris]SDZ54864.1 Uncharacterized conserved protein, DUF1330 family [Jannaschia faecimaris]